MFHYRLIFPLLLLFALASCMDPDVPELKAEIQTLTAEKTTLGEQVEKLNLALENQAAAKREEQALKEYQVAIYNGCKYIIDLCPKEAIAAGRKVVEEENYSGSTDPVYWAVVVGKLLIALALSIVGVFAVLKLWTRIMMPKRAELEALQATMAEAAAFQSQKAGLQEEIAALEAGRTALESNVAELENSIEDTQRTLADWQRACDEEEAHLRSLKAIQDLMKPWTPE